MVHGYGLDAVMTCDQSRHIIIAYYMKSLLQTYEMGNDECKACTLASGYIHWEMLNVNHWGLDMLYEIQKRPING